jgi:hypothetical protein
MIVYFNKEKQDSKIKTIHPLVRSLFYNNYLDINGPCRPAHQLFIAFRLLISEQV